MFLRGVLEVGHGGPEERANKQVAEWGTRCKYKNKRLEKRILTVEKDRIDAF